MKDNKERKMAEAHDPTAAEFEEAMKRAAKEQPEMMMPLTPAASEHRT